MKKVLSLFLVATIVFGLGSCTKEAPNQGGQNPFYVPGGTSTGSGGEDPDPTPSLPVGEVPADFTKKALLEENTGEWCGYCPDGAVKMEEAINNNPGKVIGVAVHDGDPMEVASFNTWQKGITKVGGFPNGSVEREDATSRGDWGAQVTTALIKAAPCGISMVTSESGGSIDVDVYVGYNAVVTGDTKITVMVIENDVPESSPGKQSGAAAGYVHQHVLRGLLTADAGDAISLENVGEKYTKVSYSGVDLSGMKINDMSKVHIAAFVNINSGASTTTGRDVLNAQEAGLNETKKWD